MSFTFGCNFLSCQIISHLICFLCLFFFILASVRPVRWTLRAVVQGEDRSQYPRAQPPPCLHQGRAQGSGKSGGGRPRRPEGRPDWEILQSHPDDREGAAATHRRECCTNVAAPTCCAKDLPRTSFFTTQWITLNQLDLQPFILVCLCHQCVCLWNCELFYIYTLLSGLDRMSL